MEDGAKEALKILKEQAEVKSEDADKVSIELCGQKVDVSLVSEEEEKQFWREFQSKQFIPKKNKWQSMLFEMWSTWLSIIYIFVYDCRRQETIQQRQWWTQKQNGQDW